MAPLFPTTSPCAPRTRMKSGGGCGLDKAPLFRSPQVGVEEAGVRPPDHGSCCLRHPGSGALRTVARDPHSWATFRLGRLGDTPAWLDVMVVVPRGCVGLEARLAAEGAAGHLAPRGPGPRGGTTQTGHNQAADPSLDSPSRRLPPGQQRALAATPGTTAEVTQTNPQALSQTLSFYWDVLGAEPCSVSPSPNPNSNLQLPGESLG